MQLYSAKEKQLLSDVVYTMVSFNLTYRQDRNSEGQYAYHLEPYVASACVISVLVFVHRCDQRSTFVCVRVCLYIYVWFACECANVLFHVYRSTNTCTVH